MDFLEIRRKAKERAGAAGRASSPPPGPDGSGPPARPPEPEPTPPPSPSAASAGALERAPAPGAGAAEAPPAIDGGVDFLADFFFDQAEVPGTRSALGVPLGGEEPASEAAEPREHLTFKLADEEYAVAIELVREVLKAPAITEVPRAPAHVLGVIMLRGVVIPVFDPRRRLGLPLRDASRTSRVVVCDAGGEAIGLLVDGVTEVVRLRPSDVEARPPGVGGAAAEYISGIGRDRGRMFILLDLVAVVRGSGGGGREDRG